MSAAQTKADQHAPHSSEAILSLSEEINSQVATPLAGILMTLPVIRSSLKENLNH